MVSKDKDTDTSPASIPSRQPLNWHETIKATNVRIEDNGQTVIFSDGGGFRFCRSEEEFDIGSCRCEIEFDFEGTDSQISFGISNSSPLICDSGVYNIPNSYIYCNYYPSFNHDYTSLHVEAPNKLQYKGQIAISFDIDSHTLFWELNHEVYDTYSLEIIHGKPYYIVVGMFNGKATIL